MKYLLSILVLLSALGGKAQQFNITDGNWRGTLMIWKEGKVLDSVTCELSIKSIIKDSLWEWKTTYLSAATPMTKDYKLRIKDKSKGIYITDEGDGIELLNFVFGNKMYSNFETQGILLASSYEWVGDDIVFEIASGKKADVTAEDITNFSVRNLQKVVFKRITK